MIKSITFTIYYAVFNIIITEGLTMYVLIGTLYPDFARIARPLIVTFFIHTWNETIVLLQYN